MAFVIGEIYRPCIGEEGTDGRSAYHLPNTIFVAAAFTGIAIFIFYLSLTPEDINKQSDLNVVDAVYMKLNPATADWSVMFTTSFDDSRLAQDGTLVCFYWQH